MNSIKKPRAGKPDGSGLVFGYRRDAAFRIPMGFAPPHIELPLTAGKPQLITDSSSRHALVVGPSGNGKSRAFLIPNLLQWKSSAIVIDVKGELAMTTARYRERTLGQNVTILDPFQIVGPSSGALNPLDLVRMRPEHIADNSLAQAETISAGKGSHKEPFWDDNGNDLIGGLIAYAATHPDPTRRHLGTVWDLLTKHDFDHQIAVLLDTQQQTIPRFAYDNLAMYLQHEEHKVRPSVLSTARQHMRIFSSPMLQQTIRETTVDLSDLQRGAAPGTTIYLVLEPAKLLTHSAILRLWITTLLGLLTQRSSIPEQPTLLVVDELAAIGPMRLLFSAVCLMRGYGLRCVLLVQSLSQLRGLWPREYAAVTDNCGVLAGIGPMRRDQASEVAQLIGDPSGDVITALTADRMLFSSTDLPSQAADKIDYLVDPIFRHRFDPNPYYARARGGRRTTPKGGEK